MPGPGARRRGAGIPADRLPPTVATGAVVGGLTETAADALGLRPGIPVVGGHGRRVRELPRRRAARARRRLRPGRLGRRVRRLLGPAGRGRRARSSRRRRWPACYSVGAAMAATGRALDWFRDDVLGGTITTERAARGGRRDAARRRRPRLPAVPRRRALADLGPEARGVFAGLTLGARPRPPRPGDPGGVARSRSATSRRRCSRPASRSRAMRVCGGPARSEVWNQIKADVTGFTVAVPAVLETAVLGLGDPRRGRDRRLPRPAGGDRGDDPHRPPARAAPASSRAAYDRLFEAYVGALPGDRADPRDRSHGRRDVDGATAPTPATATPRRDRPRAASRSPSGRRGGGPLPVLDGIDLASPGGGIVALIGPNGCGKSTLLRVIAGLLAPERGAAHARRRADRPARTRGSGSSSRSRGSCRGARRPTTSPTRSSSPAGRATAGRARLAELTDLVGLDPAVTGAARPSCRAGRASAWRSPGPSRWSPRCCCSTSRSAPSMR